MNRELLLFIHQDLSYPWLDYFFAWISQSYYFSIPVIFLTLVFFIYRFGKNGFRFWLLAVAVIICSDLTGGVIKDITSYPRPCAELKDIVKVPTTFFRVNCSHNLNGMPSNHALNFFAFSVFTSMILKSRIWIGIFIPLSFLVGLSRIYLGVHYPIQVLAGTILGVLIGVIMAQIALRYFPFLRELNLQHNKPASHRL